MDGRGPLEIGCDEHGPFAVLFAEHEGELEADGGRFAGALQAAHHENGGPILGEVNAMIDRPHEGDEFLVQDLDDLLRRIERLEDFLPHRLGRAPFDESRLVTS